ncbi:MAG TPA: 3-phosphoshikimate 1-carboxyvinyltransferase [Methylomusa anaerophila]|uniref:3-phosphoshikimate 1-carboxyvinyltransferase n=1 Tax=Methylomusa anaerophila TaxID=1930071 RepID=A0A348APH1_9FIRM|nr:3-phosphoshikimate 1-carboxyvinyltransferase [Methylomusa anaerophila]BBB92969.1 3-phosphoshikimate 1-carboxyvinyltransferase 1 [Methylomusa anaerophila]HML87197.1 3-phosphoshikimate 1-carboxyvinyltransferase [Methylomusa anaerophila]
MNNIIEIKPVKGLVGTISIPGDKSVSHRSVMLAGLSETPVTITNFLHAQDCWSTINCMRALGVLVEQDNSGVLTVQGKGLHNLSEPDNILDAGNSGTTLRLLTGILAAQPFFSVLTGDSSLRRRPMSRVISPLTIMGCKIIGRSQSRYAPVAISPAEKVSGIEYDTPVASAQIKSAIMLASLFANSPSTITEPSISRDHTERMMATFGITVTRSGSSVTVQPAQKLAAPQKLYVPGDISSAAFWLVAASIIPHSQLTLTNVGINPTRTGILDVLVRMGADIAVINEHRSGEEPVADIHVRSSQLKGVEIEPEIIPRLIDEIPILAVAALFAEGKTVVRGAEELRVKESDRLAAITTELSKMGANIQETPDGFSIVGPQRITMASCDSHHDHRMAMAAAIAGAAGNGVKISNAECVSISYPSFFKIIDEISVNPLS